MELPVSSSTGSMELDLDLERTPTPSQSPLPLTTSEIPIAPLPMPSTPTRRRSIFQPIPPSLLKPGTEMLKVSAKSTRRVQTKKIWLELGSGFGSGDIRLCWDKNGRGVGKRRQASIPISTIRDFRHGVDIAPYRTSLHLSPLVESRWMTIIYLAPSAPSVPLSFINNGVQTPAYKLAHLIAPTEESFLLWRETLTAFLDERTGGEAGDWEELRWREAGGGAEAVEHEEVDVRVVKEDEVLRLCRRLGVGMGKDQIATAFRKSAAPNDHLDFASFQTFVKLLKRRVDIDDIFALALGDSSGLGMSLAEWTVFLVEVQHVGPNHEKIARLFNKYSETSLDTVTIDGFNAYLISSDNAPIKDDSDQDMTRPLCEYYVSSSHNTYLVGNQIQGESTVEGYIRALQQGCRCVELDVWSGDDDSPIITHGRTFTSKISARDALLAIAKYAFLASPYPVILSLEIHCDLVQQEKLVVVLKEALGSALVSKRLWGLGDAIPSPEQLRGKILLKAKNLALPTGESESPAWAAEYDFSPSTGESSTNSDSEFKRVFQAVRRGIEERSRPGYGSRGTSSGSHSSTRSTPAQPASLRPESSAVTKSPLCPSLAALLVYTVGVKPRGFNKKETYASTHVLSFGENRLTKMIKEEGARHDLIAHNRSHLTRAYPKGIRLTSTNFHPHHLWAVGVQMVAVNRQTFDVGMELNSALFTRAGRSGYVLKPELLRRKGLEKDKDALVRTAQYVLEIEIISAQQLPRPRDALATDAESVSMDPFVVVSLSVPGCPASTKQRTKVVIGNAFNPMFKSPTISIPFSVHPSPGMSDLVFLRFEILNAKGSLKAATEEGKGEFVGTFCTGLGTLQPGYRHLPLYDQVGDRHLFSSLFVRSYLRSV